MMFITPGFEQIRSEILRDIKNQLPDADTGSDSDFFIRASSVASVAT
ncbi:phage tail protein, partial [Morganella morganii]|nr:phage tail protein [Morganella morganii]